MDNNINNNNINNNNNNPPIFGTMDNDFMDQLFDEGCWLHTIDALPTTSFPTTPPPDPSIFRSLNYRSSYPVFSLEGITENSPECEEEKEENKKAIITSSTTKCYSWEGNDELNRMLWIGPKANPGPSTPVKDRLMGVISNLRDSNRDRRDVLIQIWLPIKKGVKSFLTTEMQPHYCHPTSERLLLYRYVSERYEFSADQDTKEALLGLPGRVFLGKVPEWTPNVCYFREDEYPRVSYAHMYNVRGSIALPVFEQGGGGGGEDCLGVVEIIMTTEKINYRPEVESVCKALESVDLSSSKVLSTSHEQVRKGTREIVLPEILDVLRIVCDAHNLPLAQTWAPCSQQGKDGCWHSDNEAFCLSIVDSACYVRDHRVLDFNRACSEHHILRGRGGIVGKAFETTQPCFATDVTEFSKADYPLSHHAKMFQLRAAVALRVSTIYHEPRHYVLEFYLPSDFQEAGLALHSRILQSVTTIMGKHCRSLHFITVKDSNEKKPELLISQKNQQEETFWISHHMNKPQKKGKEMAVPLDFGEEEPIEKFNVTHWSNSDLELELGQIYSDGGTMKQGYRSNGIVEDISCSSSGGRFPLSSRRAGEKRKTKIQKTISLQVLRQHFAGSLKDAAKNIGVCPTTLKRICRQHGITRWPSRKIKKVGHSLKKLQLVIDSVQGAQGAIKISSFYTNFPELNNSDAQPTTNQVSSMNLNNQPNQQINQPENSFFGSGGATSNSPSSSSSQTSTSSQCLTGVAKVNSPITTNTTGSKDASTTQDLSASLKRAQNEAELQGLSKKESNQFFERSQSNKYIAERVSQDTPASLPISRSWSLKDPRVLKAKATFGEEKVRFTILPNMGFQDLQQEIAKRFALEDLSKIGIKYLDDDGEWVLLTCDADLEECIDIYTSTRSNIIKLTISTVSSVGGSVGSCGIP